MVSVRLGAKVETIMMVMVEGVAKRGPILEKISGEFEIGGNNKATVVTIIVVVMMVMMELVYIGMQKSVEGSKRRGGG